MSDLKSAGGGRSRFKPRRTFGRPRKLDAAEPATRRARVRQRLSSAIGDRGRRVISIVSGIALLALFAWATYAYAVPPSRRDVVGTIVMFETHASESASVSRRLIVKLDNGYTVPAFLPGHVVARVGRRVQLVEMTSPFFGLKTYRFAGFADRDEPATLRSVPKRSAPDSSE